MKSDHIIKNLVIALLIFPLLISCNQKADPKIAREFYKSITTELNKDRAEQQEFIDEVAFVIGLVKENPAASVDVSGLFELLKSVKVKNITRERNIERIEEVDTEIDYKKKILDYIKIFNEANDNEFPKTLQILSGTDPDRFTKAMDLLYPKLKLIKEKQLEMQAAGSNFNDRYPRTESIYEYVSLYDFEYNYDIVFNEIQIKDGTKIEVLSYSGGDSFDEVKIFYKQFIGINTSTGDTVRILTPGMWQNYDFGRSPKMGFFKSLQTKPEISKDGNEIVIFNKEQSVIEKRPYNTAFGNLVFD